MNLKTIWGFSIMLFSSNCTKIETPPYTVLKTYKDFEIRKYEETLVAEVTVKDPFPEAGNAGFRILANYIFGGNRSKTSIPMTSPVEQEPKEIPEKIKMTAPVDMIHGSKGYLVRFYMPSKYTHLDSLPEPLDKRILLRKHPDLIMAARTFSGSWQKKHFEHHQNILTQALKEENIPSYGKFIFSRYNSPWTLWFLRRNEVMIEVKSF